MVSSRMRMVWVAARQATASDWHPESIAPGIATFAILAGDIFDNPFVPYYTRGAVFPQASDGQPPDQGCRRDAG